MPPYIDVIRYNDTVKYLEGILGELWMTLEKGLGFKSEYSEEGWLDGIDIFLKKKRDVLLQPVLYISNKSDYFAIPVTDEWSAGYFHSFFFFFFKYPQYYKLIGFCFFRFEIYLKDGKSTSYSVSFTKNWSNDLWLSTIMISLVLMITLHAMLKFSYKIKKDEKGFLINETNNIFKLSFGLYRFLLPPPPPPP